MNNFESEIRKLACGYVSKLAGQVKPDSLKLRYVLEHFVCLTKVCLARQVNGFPKCYNQVPKNGVACDSDERLLIF